MKKLLTSVLTLALILCCFTFVGCTNDEEPKPATIEQTLAICDQFIADMQAVQTKISALDYEYPTIDAIRASKAVADTDKSSIGIEYSNYMDFDFDYDFRQGAYPDPDSISYEYYPDMLELAIFSGLYFDIYKDNDLDLNIEYRFNYTKEGDNGYMYAKLTNDNTKINLIIYTSELNYDQAGVYYSFTLNLNNNTWKSFEFTQCYKDEDPFQGYMYIEKSTDESRLINRYIECVIGDESDTSMYCSDFDETTQKMINLDGINIESMNATQYKVYNYMESLNIVSSKTAIDTENSTVTDIEIDFTENM